MIDAYRKKQLESQVSERARFTHPAAFAHPR
jgi:hypothetical protein